jgi:Mrp family chromosome partitioning ATPase
LQPADALKLEYPATTEAAPVNLEELWRRLMMWTAALRQIGCGEMNEEHIRRDLNILQEHRSRVISVSFTSKSPRQAAAVANRIVELYLANQIAQKRAPIEQELVKLGERMAELRAEIDSARTTVQTFVDKPPASDHVSTRDAREADTRLREIERGAATAGQQYFQLLRRQQELNGQLEAVKSDVSIVSLASPPHRPSSSNPILFILPATIVFAIGAGFLAVILERLDRGLRSERDITEALDIPCLGLVPQLPRAGRIRPLQHVIKAPLAPYCESIRSIVADLQLVPPPCASKIILITSSVQGEGKTTFAGSLAVYAAGLQRRVLLLDLDFRHRSGLRELTQKRRTAEDGVTDLLLNNRSPGEVIRRIPELGFDYLPITHCPRDPLALFATNGLSELLCRLRGSYDCVLIDGPPLLGVTEARMLAAMADRVLIVVKWGRTRKELVSSAVHLLRNAGCYDTQCMDVPAAVVTQADLKQHAKYRYGDVGEVLIKYKKDRSYPVART